MENIMQLRILSVRKTPHKNNHINVYITTHGIFNSNELEEYSETPKNLIFQRIRKYGLKSPLVFDPPWPGRPTSKRYGKPWGIK
jgi:hypothetical protein